jgi:ribonucleoside-diphosphate reductase alpha chain
MRHVLEQSGFSLEPENGQQYDTATTLVGAFPVKAPDGAITNGARGAIEQCEWWKMNKIHWTEHNPSVTISYVADELPDLIDWIYDNQDIIGGMSFLEKDNHYYPNAPYEKNR